MNNATDDCVFHRQVSPVADATFYQREFEVATTAAQRQVLPAVSPPENADLVAAVGGDFAGYLHHESSNLYQPVHLHIIASSSSPNPHVENSVFVTATAALGFGNGTAPEFWTQQFEPRSLYLRPGFTLESPNSDAFLQIVDWRQGYISGVWYSHAFGRVGTLQLVKGELPSIPPAASFVPSIFGEFNGPSGHPADALNWWFRTIAPPQTQDREHSFMSFAGEFQSTDGLTTRQRIDHGAYDIYSGTLAWLTGEASPRMVSGRTANAGLWLFWPGATQWGVRIPASHEPRLFQIN